MPPLERSIGYAPPSQERGSGQALTHEKKHELRERLDRALAELSLGDALNRETRRGLIQWHADRTKEGFKQAGDEAVVQYLEDLAAYQPAKQMFDKDQARFVEESRVYRERQAAYAQDLEAWWRAKQARERHGSMPRHRVTRFEVTDTTVDTRAPLPKDKPFQESPRQQPGFIDARKTEKRWQEQHQQLYQELQRASQEVVDPSVTEGLLVRLGRGPKALYAYLAMITALLVAMPRGEQSFAAGRSYPDETSLSPDRPRTPPQKPVSADRYKQLAQAPLEQVGAHELHVRLGNAQGPEELFIMGSHQVESKVYFEVGTGYRRVDMRAGEREAVQQQVQEIVRQALRPYQERGVHPEAVDMVVDQIDVTFRGGTSMEGNRAGNEALATRRVEATRDLLNEAFAVQGVPVQMVRYQQEQGGVEGDMAETARELTQMGVRLRPGEDWSSFVNQMAPLERTEGVEGVRRLFARHGAHQFNEESFNDMFERQFRAHRAVNVRVTVRHRRLVIHTPAPVTESTPPQIQPEGKPLTQLFRNDVDDPQTRVDDPPGQTSGQLLEPQMRRSYGWKVEEDVLNVPPKPPQKPQPPVRPIPPAPPTLPSIRFDPRRVMPNAAPPGARSYQKINRSAGNGGWTDTRNGH